MKKITVKQITMTAAFLAICIISQFVKIDGQLATIFITGPIVNAALILTTVYCGMYCGVLLSMITPITAFFITGSPIMSAVPMLFPCIMLGNEILVLCVALMKKTFGKHASFPVSMVIGAIAKAAVMGLLISVWILPTFLPAKMAPKLPTLQLQFSVIQLASAAVGAVYAYIIRFALDRTALRADN